MTSKRELERQNRERIQLLERYLEDREAIQDSLFRLLKSASDLRLSANEVKHVAELLSEFEGDPWSIHQQIRKLKGETS